MSIELELIVFWLAIGLYIIATVCAIIGLIWNKEKLQNIGYQVAILGALLHAGALLMRWYLAGHAPFQEDYEKLSSYAWWVLVMFFVLIRFWPGLKQGGVLLYPATLLLSGLALLSSKEITEVPATYQTIWLTVHIIFAKFAYGSALFATITSVMFLIKKGPVSKLKWVESLPARDKLDYYSYRLTALAFLMIGIMIATGAVWAHQAWGRYWYWDPIETWSLISWLLYGFILHLRFTGGRPKQTALLNVLAFVVLVITFFALPYVYESIHRS